MDERIKTHPTTPHALLSSLQLLMLTLLGQSITVSAIFMAILVLRVDTSGGSPAQCRAQLELIPREDDLTQPMTSGGINHI